MGRTLQSDKTCARISDHIAKEMRKNVCKDIITHGHKFSVLIDESTTVGRKSVLTVNLRATVSGAENPHTFFLDLLELEIY